MPLSYASIGDGDREKEYLVNWIVDNLPAATKYARGPKGARNNRPLCGLVDQ
jgi:hypothetical protein